MVGQGQGQTGLHIPWECQIPTLCSQLYADSTEGKAWVGHQKNGMDSI